MYKKAKIGIYKMISFPVVLNGRETWTVPTKEKKKSLREL
jgi:hypothetical protein